MVFEVSWFKAGGLGLSWGWSNRGVVSSCSQPPPPPPKKKKEQKERQGNRSPQPEPCLNAIEIPRTSFKTT